jgi:NADPH:quinone reductase-like Zn-dependent oxidoreductase
MLIIFPCAICGIAAIQLAKAENTTVTAVTYNPPLKQAIAAADADCVLVNRGEDLMSRVERFLEGRRSRAVLSESGDPVLERLHRPISSGDMIVETGNQPSMYSHQTTLPAEITLVHCQPEAITENARKLAEAVAYICEGLRLRYFTVDVERKFELAQLIDAYRYVEAHPARGSVVIVFPDRRLSVDIGGGK